MNQMIQLTNLIIHIIAQIKPVYVKQSIIDLKGEEVLGTLYKKELQKKNQKEFRVEKTIKRKCDKLYVT